MRRRRDDAIDTKVAKETLNPILDILKMMFFSSEGDFSGEKSHKRLMDSISDDYWYDDKHYQPSIFRRDGERP